MLRMIKSIMFTAVNALLLITLIPLALLDYLFIRPFYLLFNRKKYEAIANCIAGWWTTRFQERGIDGPSVLTTVIREVAYEQKKTITMEQISEIRTFIYNMTLNELKKGKREFIISNKYDADGILKEALEEAKINIYKAAYTYFTSVSIANGKLTFVKPTDNTGENFERVCLDLKEKMKILEPQLLSIGNK